jgi:hypothetical protein
MSLQKFQPKQKHNSKVQPLVLQAIAPQPFRQTHAKIIPYWKKRGRTLSEHKSADSFKVIDRRLFTEAGELRKEIAEEEAREAVKEAEVAKKEAATESAVTAPAPQDGAPAVEPPKRSAAFENLIRMLGSNAAMVLGAYADPRTGQPMIDPDAARELIDMLDALHEKTKGNLAPEEDSILLDLLGKLKLTYLEVNQALAAQATQAKAKTR